MYVLYDIQDPAYNNCYGWNLLFMVISPEAGGAWEVKLEWWDFSLHRGTRWKFFNILMMVTVSKHTMQMH